MDTMLEKTKDVNFVCIRYFAYRSPIGYFHLFLLYFTSVWTPIHKQSMSRALACLCELEASMKLSITCVPIKLICRIHTCNLLPEF